MVGRCLSSASAGTWARGERRAPVPSSPDAAGLDGSGLDESGLTGSLALSSPSLPSPASSSPAPSSPAPKWLISGEEEMVRSAFGCTSLSGDEELIGRGNLRLQRIIPRADPMARMNAPAKKRMRSRSMLESPGEGRGGRAEEGMGADPLARGC